ncbi:MAG TPA: hypothetical protein VMT52_12800 [Planctomycetota bacterium]|nr:hypothetical protein [Planctomycetota bacterium]
MEPESAPTLLLEVVKRHIPIASPILASPSPVHTPSSHPVQ